MSGAAESSFLFESFELRPGEGLLLRAGVEVEIARKPFALLSHLVLNRHRVVSRDELRAAIWPDVSVSDAAFTSALRDLRRAIDDDGLHPRLVVTVRGRGLRFSVEVAEAEPTPPRSGGPGASWQTASEYLDQALRAMSALRTSRGATPSGDPESRERGNLLVALARARWAGGATGEARSTFVEVAELARRLGDAEMLGEAALGLAGRTDVTPGVREEAVALMEEALAALGETHAELRSELLARLGTELTYADAGRAERLTTQAVDLAEGLAPSLLAYAITAKHFTSQGPDVHPTARLPWSNRVIELVGSGPASDVLALGLQQRMLDALELGDRAAFEHDFARFEDVVRKLDQPFFAWIEAMLDAVRAQLDGELEEAERLGHAALELGRRISSPNAEGAFTAQLMAVRRAQGRFGELVPALAALVESPDVLPAFRLALAAASAASGDEARAAAALEAVMEEVLDELPRDQNWIGALCLLTPAAARDRRHARRLRALLEPHAGRVAVAGYGAIVLGAVDHHLGVLSLALGEPAQASAQLDAADRLHRSLRAPLLIEETRRVRARS